MHSFKAILAALIGLLWLSAPAHAVTAAQVLGGSCTTSATSCTLSLTGSAPAGSFVMVVASINAVTSNTFTVSDSAGNCSGAYAGAGGSGKVLVSSATNGSIMVAYCPVTTTAMTTANTITISGTTAYFWAMSAWTVSGVSGFDKASSAVTASWTSGSATSFATSPLLGWSSEWALGIVAVSSGAATDTLGSYSGGYATVGAQVSTTSRPEFFTSAQVLTTGTATLGATPTSSAARGYNSIVLLFPTTGALALSRPTRTLLGVGQ